MVVHASSIHTSYITTRPPPNKTTSLHVLDVLESGIAPLVGQVYGQWSKELPQIAKTVVAVFVAAAAEAAAVAVVRVIVVFQWVDHCCPWLDHCCPWVDHCLDYCPEQLWSHPPNLCRVCCCEVWSTQQCSHYMYSQWRTQQPCQYPQMLRRDVCGCGCVNDGVCVRWDMGGDGNARVWDEVGVGGERDMLGRK